MNFNLCKDIKFSLQSKIVFKKHWNGSQVRSVSWRALGGQETGARCALAEPGYLPIIHQTRNVGRVAVQTVAHRAPCDPPRAPAAPVRRAPQLLINEILKQPGLANTRHIFTSQPSLSPFIVSNQPDQIFLCRQTQYGDHPSGCFANIGNIWCCVAT